MAENRMTLGQLTEILGERAKHHHERNLVLVALPLETAHRIAEQLAQRLGAEYIDFDCQLLARTEEDGWDDHVALERRGTLSVGQMLARRWLGDVADLMNRERPLVIGNLNLAIRYDLDVAGAIYDATERGLCIIAAGGRLERQTLLIHGRLPQTGAGSPAYEVVSGTGDMPPESPSTLQERLL
jgi:hypothetical protein